jgi:hypothetical protein
MTSNSKKSKQQGAPGHNHLPNFLTFWHSLICLSYLSTMSGRIATTVIVIDFTLDID